MKQKLINRIQLCNSKGSYTLEAAIILPAIMFILFFLTFFSMWVYQRLVVLDTAIYTSKQRAATWDNSIKDLETGSKGGSLATDGLYWRLFQDFDNSDLAVSKNWEANAIAGEKLGTGVFRINSQGIDVKYDNQLVQRKVTAQVDQNVLLPAWMSNLVGYDLQARSDALVVEPVEYIRTVDFLLNLPQGMVDIYGNLQKGRQEPVRVPKVYITRNQYDVKVYHTDPDCQYVRRIVKNGNLEIVNSAEDERVTDYRECKVCEAKRLKN